MPAHGIEAEELVIREEPQEKQRAVINAGFPDGFPGPHMAGEEGWYVLPGIELAGVHDLAVVVVNEIKMQGLGKNGDGGSDEYEGRKYAKEGGARRAKG
jgi:hypothetical protein